MGNLERITFIDRRIRERGGVKVAEIVRRFEVSERQAKRDLEYLRDRLNAPIAWDASSRRYVYEQAWTDLVFADQKSLLFYVFARAAAGTLAYVPLAESEAMEKLRDLVPPGLRELGHAVRYELPGYEPVDEELLSLLLEAIRDRHGVDARYRDLEGREGMRLLTPRRIVNYAGTWYCLAFDATHRDLRMFRLSRFLGVSLSREAVDSGPDEAEIEAHLDAAYGMFKGTNAHEARIRFRGRAREIVRGELWHPEQKIASGSDEVGSWFDLCLPASHWDELVGRILRFGAEAEALEPTEFRERWLSAIDALVETAASARTRKPLHKRRGPRVSP